MFNPTKGSIFRINQTLPIVADKPYIQNILAGSTYKSISEDFIWATKFFISTIDGLGDENVRLSKRSGLSKRRLEVLKEIKLDPKMDQIILGNYAAALNLETNLPNLLPEKTNMDVSLF